MIDLKPILFPKYHITTASCVTMKIFRKIPNNRILKPVIFCILGSVIAVYDIVMALNASKVNMTELHSAVSNVIKTANFTGLDVDTTYVPPPLTGEKTNLMSWNCDLFLLDYKETLSFFIII